VELVKEHINKEILLRRATSLIRYGELLPVNTEVIKELSLGEGFTPLIRCRNLGIHLGIKELYVKYEGLNPTGTFIDRGSVVGISIPFSLRMPKVITAGLGDLVVSASTYAVRAGIKPIAVVPQDLDVNKLNQIKVLGSAVKLVTDYEEALRKGIELSRRLGYSLIINTSPFMLDGFKTEGYEIIEQLGYKAPRKLFVPVGDGANIVMIYRGMKEFLELGLIDELSTKMIAVQHSPKSLPVPIGRERRSLVAKYVREIAIKRPLMHYAVTKVLRESGGTAVLVNDEDLINAMKLLAKYEGIIVDPLGASGLAGLVKALSEGLVSSDDEVVVLITASPIKHPLFLSDLTKAFSRIEETPLLSETKLAILEVIMSKGALHPYGIWRVLKESMGIDIKPTTVYQHIRDLEEQGLVIRERTDVSGGNIKIIYRLTGKGVKVLKSIYG